MYFFFSIWKVTHKYVHVDDAVLSCQVLVCRNYRGDVDMSEIEHFMSLLMDKEEEGTLSPILAHGGVRFMWIKHNNLYCILPVGAPLQIVWESVLKKTVRCAKDALVMWILNTCHISGCNVEEERECLPGFLLFVQNSPGGLEVPASSSTYKTTLMQKTCFPGVFRVFQRTGGGEHQR